MSILKYIAASPRVLLGIGTLALLSLTALGCNQDGVGIFYSISQEEEQITSKISEVNVYQVVEADPGNTIYALGGRTVWQQSGENWSSLGGGFAYNIVANDSGTGPLFAYFNNDDDNLEDGRIKELSGGWTSADSFSDDGRLMDIGNNTYALSLKGGTLHINNTLAGISQTSVGTASIIGGTHLSGTTHYLISDSTVYRWDSGSLTPLTFTSGTEPGDFAAITTDGTNLYLVTTSGQVFNAAGADISPTEINWTYLKNLDESVDADFGAAAVVESGGPKLMIGTYSGYYLMELNGTIIETPDDYAASYPELSDALVYQVYQAPSNDNIYLATENGLWKRTGSGEFERQ